ncbi:hypothetical protein CTEN210_11296 [Chaetoceros tenuissimus]|uniref:Centromere protein J C-terminal domain-containing protein n=1 Tax=Chaetoceros tenuissimus TaxID=426638 RepID=A0AAD3D1K6_9STRA|nr:hypothetical protein CTEN210_11296 [Chaetoceros tenuissimus]
MIKDVLSPIPPPPPFVESKPFNQHPKSIRDILDDYYEEASFSSDENSSAGHFDSMNIADSVLAEIERISPAIENICSSKNNMPGESFPPKPREHNSTDEIVSSRCEETVEEKKQQSITVLSEDAKPVNKIEIEPPNAGNAKTTLPLHEVETNTKVVTLENMKPQDVGIETVSSSKTSNPTSCKKKFLRKGSRKEPSALHRLSLEETVKRPMSRQKSLNETIKEEKIKNLEKMQEKQLEDLKKRIDRRQKAREDIQKKKNGCKVQVSDIVDASEKEMTQGKRGSSTNPNDSQHSVDGSSCESSSNSSYSLESEEDSNDDKSSSDIERVKETKSRVIKESTRQSKHQSKERMNPKRTLSTRLDKDMKRRSTSNSKMEFKSPEIEEQWQLIKSMRRRQETALRNAEKEREETKAWAAAEKEKLNRWKDQQRTLIEKEKKRVNNSIMISQRKKRQEKLEEQAAEAVQFSSKKAREEINGLTESLNKSRVEMDVIKSRHRLNEKRWKDMIGERDKRILELRQELDSTIEIQQKSKAENTTLLEKIDRLMEENRKMKSKLKKKSKEAKKIQDDTKAKETRDENSEDSSHDVKEEERCNEKRALQDDHIVMDNDLLRSINTHPDLLPEPKEDWLRANAKANDDTCEPTADDVQTNSTSIDRPKKEPSTFFPPSESNSHHRDDNVGSRLTTYQNGTVKETFPDGTTIVRFVNGDVKTSYKNIGITVYFYHESKTSHTTHPDGTQLFEFASGQKEKHLPNGEKEVCYPDGTVQLFLPDRGGTETLFPDGVRLFEETGGRKDVLNF